MGDPDYEWREIGYRAAHLRRRLSPLEQVGFTVTDIRGTPEADARLAAMGRWLPDGYAE